MLKPAKVLTATALALALVGVAHAQQDGDQARLQAEAAGSAGKMCMKQFLRGDTPRGLLDYYCRVQTQDLHLRELGIRAATRIPSQEEYEAWQTPWNAFHFNVIENWRGLRELRAKPTWATSCVGRDYEALLAADPFNGKGKPKLSAEYLRLAPKESCVTPPPASGWDYKSEAYAESKENYKSCMAQWAEYINACKAKDAADLPAKAEREAAALKQYLLERSIP